MKTIKAALLTAAMVTGVAVTAATPAQALSHCTIGGKPIICDYGVSRAALPGGTLQDFAIGTDKAVWTRWTTAPGSWTSWQYMGGQWRSAVTIRTQQLGASSLFAIVAKGTDDYLWWNLRDI